MKGVHLYGCNERKYDFKNGAWIEGTGGCPFQISWNGFEYRNRYFLSAGAQVSWFAFWSKLDEPNEVTYAAMEAAEKDEDMYGPFDSVAEMMEALNA